MLLGLCGRSKLLSSTYNDTVFPVEVDVFWYQDALTVDCLESYFFQFE